MSTAPPPMFLSSLNIYRPLVGLYDTPDVSPFTPVAPKPKHCFFSHYENWMQGEYTILNRENFTCPGCGYWLLDTAARDRESLIKFLVQGEGLKASCELMGRWLDFRHGYKPTHESLVLGPLLEGQEAYLKTITMFITPDQLSALMIGTQYFAEPTDPEPVLCRFGSGCSQLVALFDDLDKPQAIVSMTDTAMRPHLPPDTLGLTVTRSMYNRLCQLDETSFLNKSFWQTLNRVPRSRLSSF